MEVSITGQHTTLIVLHRDAPGTIAAVTEVMAEAGVNICNFRLSRQQKGGDLGRRQKKLAVARRNQPRGRRQDRRYDGPTHPQGARHALFPDVQPARPRV